MAYGLHDDHMAQSNPNLDRWEPPSPVAPPRPSQTVRSQYESPSAQFTVSVPTGMCATPTVKFTTLHHLRKKPCVLNCHPVGLPEHPQP